MSLQSLQRVLRTQLAAPLPSPPAAGLVGLALPLAALGIMLLGANLHVLGLLGWTVAVALVAAALPRVAAAAVIAALAVAGALLAHLTAGEGALERSDQAALALLTVSAWIIGRMLLHLKHRRDAEQRDAADAGLQQRVMEALFEGSRDCVKLLAADGEVLAINTCGLKLIAAASEAQMVGQNWFEFWDADQQKALAAAWKRALETGFAQFPGQCRILNGERRHWENSFTALRLPGAAQPLIVCFSRDVTEVTTAQQALQTNNAQLNLLLSSIDDVFVALDSNWAITFINPPGLQWLAPVPLTPLLGRNFWELFPEPTGAAAASLRRAMQQQSVEKFVFQDVAQQSWLSVTAFPYPGGISLLARDITSLIAAERRVEEENARLQVAQDIAGFADWCFDCQEGVLSLSPRALTLLQLPPCPAAEHKKRVLEQLQPRDRMVLVQAIIDAASVGTAVDVIVRGRSGDAARHLHWAGRAVGDGRGGTARVLGAVRDVTAQQTAQELQREAEHFVRSIVDALPNSVCVLDRDGRIVTVNPAWLRGWRQYFGGEMRGDNLITILKAVKGEDSGYAQALLGAIADIVEGRKAEVDLEYSLSVTHRGYVGHLRWLPSPAGNLVLISHEDVVLMRQLIDDAAAQEHHLARAMSATNDGVWEWSPATGETFYSQRFIALLGLQRDAQPAFEALLRSRVHPQQRAQVENLLRTDHGCDCSVPFDLELQLQPGGGEYRWFRLRGLTECDARGNVVCFSGALMDIQPEKDLQCELRQRDLQLRELAEHMSEVFWSFDLEAGRLTYISPAIERASGVAPEAVMADPEHMLECIHPDDRGSRRRFLQQCGAGEGSGSIEYRVACIDGTEHWVEEHCYAVCDDRGRPVRLIGMAQDITERKRHEQQLCEAAHRDELTGLPNRKALNRALRERCGEASAPVPGASFAVLLIDLDRFKNLNDILGHSVGDALLCQVAERLRGVVGAGGMLARLGGDEFAVMADSGCYETLIDQVMGSFREPFELDGERSFITASMGVALCPRDGADPEALLRFADMAMYRAKQAGRDNYQFFRHSMALPSRERLALENELRTALQNREFELFYQGKYELESGRLIGCEALLRWRSQRRGLVSPADFIPLLEETGLILPVGEWILAQACRQVREWHTHTGRWVRMAVNVSAIQVANRNFGDSAVEILRAGDIPADTVELELTESALMADVGRAAQLLKRLKQAGFTIALDDFGTGYSSLSYLRKFAPDTLKLDRSFIADLESDPHDVEIVTGIVHLAQALRIDVVAEGIETHAQCRILQELGCRRGQGYLLGRPLPAAEFASAVLSAEGGQRAAG